MAASVTPAQHLGSVDTWEGSVSIVMNAYGTTAQQGGRYRNDSR